MPIGSIVIPIAFFAMIVGIVWLSVHNRRRDTDRRAELVRQLIDKFTSGEAFAEAIKGPGGSKLAEALSLSRGPAEKSWVGLFVPGALLSCLGIGFAVLGFLMGDAFKIPAVIVGSLGVAFLLSSYVAWRADRKESEEDADGADDGTQSQPSLPG